MNEQRLDQGGPAFPIPQTLGVIGDRTNRPNQFGCDVVRGVCGGVRRPARPRRGRWSHQPIGFLRGEQPAGAAGQVGHVGASLVKDQIHAGAQAVPALLERRDTHVAAADFEGDGAGGKCFLQRVDP